jgi:hypothetical protein
MGVKQPDDAQPATSKFPTNPGDVITSNLPSTGLLGKVLQEHQCQKSRHLARSGKQPHHLELPTLLGVHCPSMEPTKFGEGQMKQSSVA